jgi:hypothetical protein
MTFRYLSWQSSALRPGTEAATTFQLILSHENRVAISAFSL